MQPEAWRSGPRQETAAHQNTNKPRVSRNVDNPQPPLGGGWVANAGLAIRQLALSGRGFDVDHVLELVGPPDHPEQIGAAIAAARRTGVITCVGSRVAADNRLLRVYWRGVAL